MSAEDHLLNPRIVRIKEAVNLFERGRKIYFLPDGQDTIYRVYGLALKQSRTSLYPVWLVYYTSVGDVCNILGGAFYVEDKEGKV